MAYDKIISELRDLYKENAELRHRLHEIHRRAQASEGAVLRYEKILESNERLVKAVRHEASHKYEFWKKLYDDAVDQLIKAGVDDKIDGDPLHRTGHLDELIRRIIKQRDELIR